MRPYVLRERPDFFTAFPLGLAALCIEAERLLARLAGLPTLGADLFALVAFAGGGLRRADSPLPRAEIEAFNASIRSTIFDSGASSGGMEISWPSILLCMRSIIRDRTSSSNRSG